MASHAVHSMDFDFGALNLEVWTILFAQSEYTLFAHLVHFELVVHLDLGLQNKILNIMGDAVQDRDLLQ